MITKRTIATLTALGGFTAAMALLSGLPSAKADELSDLRANQELLQQRIDQLAQVPVAPAAAGAAIGAGSFPRSFLIPGTDTSLRVGGFGIGRITWFLRGVQPNADLFGQGAANQDRTEGGGGTGNLPNIPLHGAISHSKGEAFFISGKSSRIFLDSRTPTAWGVAQAYIEFDFNTSNTNVLLNSNFGVVPNNPARFRQGYAALGPVLLGMANGSFPDNDSDIEVIDDGGQVGGPGRSRVGQLRYTWTSPWPGVTVIGALEQPNSEFESPIGTFNNGYATAVVTSNCAFAGSLAVGGTPDGVGCLGNTALFDAAQGREPAGTLSVRFDQPWGHLRFGAVLRDAVLNDGFHLDKTWIGYGGTVSGDVKPFPTIWPKDDIGFSATAGEGIGGYIPNVNAVATNWGGNLGGMNPTIVGGMLPGCVGAGVSVTACTFNITPTSASGPLHARILYDSLVRGSTITAFAAKLGYVHWWTDQLRTNRDYSFIHQDVPSLLITTPGINNKGGSNKELSTAHINLLWSPVAFVTTGIEYSWGHRVVQSNVKGDAHLIQGMVRVNF